MALTFITITDALGQQKQVNVASTSATAYLRQIMTIGDPSFDLGVAPVDSFLGLSVNPTTIPPGASTDATVAAMSAKIVAVDTGAVVVTSSALPTGAATQATAASILAAVTGVAVSAKQSDGSQKTQIVDGANVTITSTGAALDVNIKSGGGAGGTSNADKTSFTPGSGLETPAGGLYQTVLDTVSNNQTAVFAITPKRGQHVYLVDVDGNPLSIGGGTQYTQDVAAVAAPIGNALNLVRRDTPSTGIVSANGDNISAGATNKGELYVKHIDSIPVTVASLPLPALASTSTKQSDGSQKTQVVDGSGNVIGATANALDVNIKSGAGSGGTAIADKAAFTTGSTNTTPASGLYQTTLDTITDGHSAAVAITAKRGQHCYLVDANGDPLSVTGGTQYVQDVAGAAAPVGNALNLIRRDALSGSTVSANGDNIAGGATSKGELYVKHVDAIPITAASLPLPTGASTETTLSLLNAKVTAVNTGAVVVSSSALPTGAATQATLASIATLLTPPTGKVAKIALSGSGTLVPLVSAKIIRVISYNLMSSGTVSLNFQSHVTTSKATGAMPFVANTGMVGPYNPLGLFDTVAGEALDLNFSVGGVPVGGHLTYLEI